MVKLKKTATVPAAPAVNEPEVVTAPAPAPLQEEATLPWLDCDGNVLLEGDKATVLPDVSKRLSGKLVKVLGDYDPQKKSVQVEPVGWEGDDFGILLCYLKRLPVLGENLEEPFDPYKLPHFTEVRAEQDREATRITSGIMATGQLNPELAAKFNKVANARARRQEPVAPFAVAGQATHEAAQPPITSADIEEAVNTPTATTAPVYTPTKMKLVPLADIVVTSNTRKVFDETELQGLADSIKAQGVIAPITVRPHAGQPSKFELVAGERRYRASKLAEQATIPAVIRTLTDREFLEVQLLENLQRVDVRPADEATAFAQLLKSGFASDEIAQKVGKPVKFVLQRAKLASLMPFWLDALEEGRLPIVAANEIARLPDESQSRLEETARRNYDTNRPGAVFAAQWVKTAISQYVLRELNAAAFHKHDATLCPKAGACTTCPKRSGAIKQLFEEEELKHDYCLDSTCFESKRKAFVERRKSELHEQTGKPAILLSSSYYDAPKGALDCYSYKVVTPETGGAVEALLVDGVNMGQTQWVVVKKNADKSEQDKEADAARLRRERVTKTHRVMLAEKLTADVPAAVANPGGPKFNAMLDYLLTEECSSSKDTLEYLRQSWGWEPTEEALRNNYNDKDERGFGPWLRFVLAQVQALTWDKKLELYLALKCRYRMNYDYESRQTTIATLIGGFGYPEVASEAEKAVEARYYSKGKKKEATA